MSMEPCVLAKACLMDRRCVDYHQCVVDQVTELTVRADERAKTAEDIARAIEHVCQCAHEPDSAIVEGCEYRRAAAIAREHGKAATT